MELILTNLLKMISEMFSPHIETVLHDMQKKNYPILAIFNSELSGRKIGDNTSVFGSLDEDMNTQPDKVVNYIFTAPNGKKYRSSSLIIRNESGTPVYGVSINFDSTQLNLAIDILQQFSKNPIYSHSLVGKPNSEITPDTIRNDIQKIKINYHMKTQQLSKEDISLIIEELNRLKYFDIHGVITIVSNELKITRPTLYKYLKSIRGQK